MNREKYKPFRRFEVTKGEYDRVHTWVRYHYGKANMCISETCNKKSNYYTWALKRGETYSKDISKFQQMCKSCHGIYDRDETTIALLSKNSPNTLKTECIKGHPFDDANCYLYKGKFKVCKTCRKIWNADYRARNKEKTKIRNQKRYLKPSLSEAGDNGEGA